MRDYPDDDPNNVRNEGAWQDPPTYGPLEGRCITCGEGYPYSRRSYILQCPECIEALKQVIKRQKEFKDL